MASPLETGLLVVGGVALLAWLIKSFGKRDETVSDPGSVPAAERDVEDDMPESAIGEVAAISSDGWAFVPDREVVRLVPPGEEDPEIPASLVGSGEFQMGTDRGPRRGAPVNPKTGKAVTHLGPGEHLVRGDLIAARVRRGAPDHDPWRVEALGREREYRAWRFETEEAARATLALLDGRIVRAPRDEDGESVSIGEEDFAAARRIDEETEAELANWDPESERDDQDDRR